MIGSFISWALKNKIIVLMIAAVTIAYGIYCVKTTPVDAIPDLSENQVIIYTEWMGRNPKTGETIQIPVGRKVSFKPSFSLKKLVRLTPPASGCARCAPSRTGWRNCSCA